MPGHIGFNTQIMTRLVGRCIGITINRPKVIKLDQDNLTTGLV